MRTGAGFHGDQAGRLLSKKRKHLAAPQLFAENDSTGSIGPMHLKHILRQIQSDRANIHCGRFLCCGS
jgi:hypothetical protein